MEVIIMKSFRTLNGTVNKYVQILLNGLQGPNYCDYVDLLTDSLHSELDDWDQYCWYPNEDETIWMILKESGNSVKDSIRYFMNSDYDCYAPFIHISDLSTMEYSELSDLYVQMLTELDSHYEKILMSVLTEIKDELEELSDRDATTTRPTNIRPVRRN
jgi:hypothetical protein